MPHERSENHHDHPGPEDGRRRTRNRGRGRGRGPGGGRGFGRPGGWQQGDLPPAAETAAWLTGRLPSEWFVGAPEVSVDREEVVVIGELPPIEGLDGHDSVEGEAAALGRISRFREDTRSARMQIADEAEDRFGRKVAWGASVGDLRVLFTHLAVPVMTRLRQPERQVLDTLVDAGVARSRADALAWAVRLVGEHTDDWLVGLRTAMSEVDKLRSEGPDL